MDVNILGVLIGSGITLISTNLVEFIKNKKQKNNKKIEIISKMTSVARKMVRYIILEWQMDVLFAYHKRIDELNNDEFHRGEAQRRQLQLEDFKLKAIDLEEKLNYLSVEYRAVVNDEKFSEFMSEINKWDQPSISDYSNILDLNSLNRKCDSDDDGNTKYIERTLGKSVDKLIRHINQKI